MKRIIVLIVTFFTSLAGVLAQNADGVKGVWTNESKNVKVEIYKSGDKYAGKIIWSANMYEADGKTLKEDSKNSNESLKSRTILNMDILTGFTYNDGAWTGGELYDPKSGKTYDSKMKIKGDKLEIRGYVSSPMFGKTTVWTRVS